MLLVQTSGACAMLLLVAVCALSTTSSVELTGAQPQPSTDGAKVGAKSRLAAKALGPPATAAVAAAAKSSSSAWNDAFSNVREAAEERMQQLSAMMKQQHESDDAMSRAKQEAQEYDVLSFKTGSPQR